MDTATERELDAAARANLSDIGYRRYLAYKVEVGSEPDCDEILRGWIWDEAEDEEAQREPIDPSV